MHNARKHFLDGLDNDLQENLIKALREEWTHHSTALEGNSLTLGETAYVLAEERTIDGKPLKDHVEVLGHGQAVDWALEMMNKASLLFASVHTSFVSIHPFWDGNGRMARLLANIPLLRAGLPPIVIQKNFQTRQRYIQLLQGIHQNLGVFDKHNHPIPIPENQLAEFATFCHQQWARSLKLVEEAHSEQNRRLL